MADNNGLDVVLKGLGIGGGGTVLILIGSLLRGLLTGTTGQEKELRDGLAERVAALEAKVTLLETRQEALTRERDNMRFQRDRARIERDTARARVSAYEIRLGETPTAWAADTPDP